MNIILAFIGVVGVIGLAIAYFLTAKPKQIIAAGRIIVPLCIGGLGVALALSGRLGLGAPMVMFAFVLWSKWRAAGGVKTAPSHNSTVRSAMLEMMLDHDTGAMNGVVLAGNLEGAVLDDLAEDQLMALAEQLSADAESVQLLEAYLDRRLPHWRDNMQADTGAGSASTAQSGAMTEQEAHQILGLEPGATAAEIRKAHRSLMQRVHPDVGGNAFLAQRINEAKDFLLRSHSK